MCGRREPDEDLSISSLPFSVLLPLLVHSLTQSTLPPPPSPYYHKYNADCFIADPPPALPQCRPSATASCAVFCGCICRSNRLTKSSMIPTSFESAVTGTTYLPSVGSRHAASLARVLISMHLLPDRPLPLAHEPTQARALRIESAHTRQRLVPISPCLQRRRLVLFVLLYSAMMTIALL